MKAAENRGEVLVDLFACRHVAHATDAPVHAYGERLDGLAWPGRPFTDDFWVVSRIANPVPGRSYGLTILTPRGELDEYGAVARDAYPPGEEWGLERRHAGFPFESPGVYWLLFLADGDVLFRAPLAVVGRGTP